MFGVVRHFFHVNCCTCDIPLTHPFSISSSVIYLGEWFERYQSFSWSKKFHWWSTSSFGQCSCFWLNSLYCHGSILTLSLNTLLLFFFFCFLNTKQQVGLVLNIGIEVSNMKSYLFGKINIFKEPDYFTRILGRSTSFFLYPVPDTWSLTPGPWDTFIFGLLNSFFFFFLLGLLNLHVPIHTNWKLDYAADWSRIQLPDRMLEEGGVGGKEMVETTVRNASPSDIILIFFLNSTPLTHNLFFFFYII